MLAIRQIEHPQQRHGVLRGATVSAHVSIKATPPELRLPLWRRVQRKPVSLSNFNSLQDHVERLLKIVRFDEIEIVG